MTIANVTRKLSDEISREKVCGLDTWHTTHNLQPSIKIYASVVGDDDGKSDECNYFNLPLVKRVTIECKVGTRRTSPLVLNCVCFEKEGDIRVAIVLEP